MKHNAKRIVSTVCALAMCAAMVPATAIAEEPAQGASNGVTIDKTATDLVNDQTDVTLSIGANQTTTVSDVVFVLDKSASLDIRNEAMNMLTELKNQSEEGNIIKVGVVNFESGILNELKLTELNDSNYSTIRDFITYINTESSGTNIHAGLVAGEQMLDGDTAVANEN